MEKISLFGAGFIGRSFAGRYDVEVVPREQVVSPTKNILYTISTIHNYHPFADDDPYRDINTNLLHFMKVLSNNRQAVFNLVSTWFVYGDTQLPAREDSYCNPKGFYSITARAREQLLISYCETLGIQYRILRLCNVIGIGDTKISEKKNALQFMTRELAQGREIRLYKNGAIRDFMDVRDTVKAIGLVLEKGKLNQIYNIGNGQGLNVYDLVMHAWQACGYTGKINEIETPPFHRTVQTPKMWLDTRRLNDLGYVKSHDIKTSLTELVHHYQHEKN